jgi:hypothetical protein
MVAGLSTGICEMIQRQSAAARRFEFAQICTFQRHRSMRGLHGSKELDENRSDEVGDWSDWEHEWGIRPESL